MKDAGILQQTVVDLINVQPLVGARVTVENKLGAVLVRHGNDRHRRSGFLIESDPAGIDALSL